MKNSYCIIFAIFLIFFITQSVVAVEYRYAKNGFKYAYHAHSESSYQHAWCSAHKGIAYLRSKLFLRGMFYILTNDNNVYFSQTGAALAIHDVDLLALLRECIAKDLDKITVETFRKVRAKVAKNHKNLSDARIRRYFSMLNRHLKDLTLLSEREFIYSEHRDGVWTVDL